jgi:hypothetical protein
MSLLFQHNRKIEHRLFCHITQNWRGRPLESRTAVVELIAATTTKTGLKVECVLDKRTYEKGIKVSDAGRRQVGCCSCWSKGSCRPARRW